MLPIATVLLLTAFAAEVVSGLKCYTGFSVIRGQTTGTTSEECSSSLDSCYRLHVDVTMLNVAQMAGCSTVRCALNKNKCIEQDVSGAKASFCCCNDKDLCNSAPRLFAPAPAVILLPFLSFTLYRLFSSLL